VPFWFLTNKWRCTCRASSMRSSNTYWSRSDFTVLGERKRRTICSTVGRTPKSIADPNSGSDRSTDQASFDASGACAHNCSDPPNMAVVKGAVHSPIIFSVHGNKSPSEILGVAGLDSLTGVLRCPAHAIGLESLAYKYYRPAKDLRLLPPSRIVETLQPLIPSFVQPC